LAVIQAETEYHPEIKITTKLSPINQKDLQPQHVVITISDNGCGIPEFYQRQNLSTILYYQANRTRDGVGSKPGI